MRICFRVSVVVLCVIAGCGKPFPKNILQSQSRCETITEKQGCQQNENVLEIIREREAKLVDIPIPFNAQALPAAFSHDEQNGSYELGYQLSCKADDVEQFYRAEMERLGWNESFSIKGTQTLLVFEKPSRLCILSIHQQPDALSQDYIKLLIFIGRRRLEKHSEVKM